MDPELDLAKLALAEGLKQEVVAELNLWAVGGGAKVLHGGSTGDGDAAVDEGSGGCRVDALGAKGGDCCDDEVAGGLWRRGRARGGQDRLGSGAVGVDGRGGRSGGAGCGMWIGGRVIGIGVKVGR